MRYLARPLLEQIPALTTKIAELEKDLRRRAPQDEQIGRLMTVPGVGATCASAVSDVLPVHE